MRHGHFFLAVIALTSLAACGKIKELRNDVAPGRVVAISAFKCNCEPIVAETVQDTFLDVFFKNTNARPIKGDSGDIVIAGVMTIETGGSSDARSSNFGNAHSTAYGATSLISGGGKASSATGVYVTGITVQAYRNGEIIATHSVGNNLRGGVLVSPVVLATQAAQFLSTRLVRQNEIGRK